MGVEQPESKDREGKKRIVISVPGRPDKTVYIDKTKVPEETRVHKRKPETRKIAPLLMRDPAFNAPIIPLETVDLYWAAYQKGFRDGRLKEKQS